MKTLKNCSQPGDFAFDISIDTYCGVESQPTDINENDKEQKWDD
jgi:hypothetical protein